MGKGDGLQRGLSEKEVKATVYARERELMNHPSRPLEGQVEFSTRVVK